MLGRRRGTVHRILGRARNPRVARDPRTRPVPSVARCGRSRPSA